MEQPIDKFNKAVQEYTDAFASTEDQKEQDKLTKKHEKKIDKAEVVLEKEQEALVKAESKELESEQEADRQELIALEKKFQERMAEKNKAREARKKAKEAGGAIPYTKTELRAMPEKKIVQMAKDLGIKATLKDLKADTIDKILAKLEDNQ